ncbi:PadR family transcriptional regulator [Actinomadura rupiterrae]|uniref:PadR family transcriptional regulator n=1 Tax=Actinomadura rupiterrae TaxID=559627 RepID=UPI0020A5D6D3|nr:PadR family transcriptional regulator [Actinomadura rupiterrae]MCP2341348.1 DNA-binding PadR family transcriptional regulator [Actinomadura rupiterrae]
MSIRHALLSLLAEGPKYGLRLREEFEHRTGELWPLNVGQVYTSLQRLERDGLIESDDEAGDRSSQKRYRLTRAGRDELDGWLRAPSGVTPPPRDELVIKLMVAATVPGVDVHEVVQVHRRQVVESMQRLTALKAATGAGAAGGAGDDGLALVADAELFRLDAVYRWLDTAEVRLARLARERVPDGPVPQHTRVSEQTRTPR